MAYASFSVIFGEQPSAAKWNILGTNDSSFNDGTGIASLSNSVTAISNPYKFSVYRNGAQNTSAGAAAKVNFDSELFDTNSNFDSTVNYRYTAPVSGFYQFGWCVSTAVANTRWFTSLYKNGATEIARGDDSSVSVSGAGNGGSRLLQLTAADTVEVQVFCNAAIAIQTDAAGALTWFSGFLVSRT